MGKFSDALAKVAPAFADGGAVPSAEDLKLWDLPGLVGEAVSRYVNTPLPWVPEPTAAERAELSRPALRYPSSGRRPERLNASRDANPLQAVRGWAAGAAGLPGDTESFLRMLVPGVSNTPALPTSEFYRGWLPGASELPADRALSGLASLSSGAGATKVAGALQRGAGKAARIGAQLADEALTTAGRRGLAGQLGAVRTRGGNFDPEALKVYIDEISGRGWVPEPNEYNPAGGGAGAGDRGTATQQWADKQLANYLKKDLGAPTDPLLQVEKELPGLHLPPDAMEDPWKINNVLNKLDAGEPVGGLNRNDRITNAARLHRSLTDQTMTPWGWHSDRELKGLLPDEYAEKLLTEKYGSRAEPYQKDLLRDLPTSFSNEHGLPPDVLNNYAHEFAHGTPGTLESLAEYSPGHKALLDSFKATRAKVVPPWVDAADPNKTLTWELRYPANDMLGFGHVLDYLDAATGAHKSVQDALGALGGDAGLRRALQMGGPGNELVRAAELYDAGLALDPQSLGRLSVADAVRKTAAWNEHLAKTAEASPDLARGIARVHKEYPEAGMRWVELGKPEMNGLPEGWTLTKGPWAHAGGEWALSSPENKGSRYFKSEADAIRHAQNIAAEAELSAGLNAEGEAMGHCVGGYCDDVASRGTKIYSLRDAKGNPHVTVEVRPTRVQSPADWYHQVATDEDKARIGYHSGSDVIQPTMTEWSRKIETDPGYLAYAQNPSVDIVQIKGKQNAAPVDKYLPYVQDFVKSGRWGRVGDLGNTGLVQFKGGTTVLHGPTTEPLRGAKFEMPSGYMTPSEAAEFLIKQGAPEGWARSHVGDYSNLDRTANRQNYAVGGVVRSRFEAALAAKG